MPHSLRCRLKGLCHKKILTDREVARLCKALDTADAIEDIKAEIEEKRTNILYCVQDFTPNDVLDIIDDISEIIDKHTK